MPALQRLWWLLTIPEVSFTPRPDNYPNDDIDFIKGQLEIAPTTGFRHWQVAVHFRKKKTLAGAKVFFHDSAHLEPVNNIDRTLDYVHKDETADPDTRFQFGMRPMRANSSVDWGLVFDQAKTGQYTDIPAHIKVRNFSSLLRITSFYDVPPMRQDVQTFVYWGVTGAGNLV